MELLNLWILKVAKPLLTSKKSNVTGAGFVGLPTVYMFLVKQGIPPNHAAILTGILAVLVVVYVVTQGQSDKGKEAAAITCEQKLRSEAAVMMLSVKDGKMPPEIQSALQVLGFAPKITAMPQAAPVDIPLSPEVKLLLEALAKAPGWAKTIQEGSIVADPSPKSPLTPTAEGEAIPALDPPHA